LAAEPPDSQSPCAAPGGPPSTPSHPAQIRSAGKAVAYNEIFIGRFAGGRLAEIWGVVDVFSQMQQLGAIPA
jgi:hypothetical protein